MAHDNMKLPIRPTQIEQDGELKINKQKRKMMSVRNAPPFLWTLCLISIAIKVALHNIASPEDKEEKKLYALIWRWKNGETKSMTVW